MAKAELATKEFEGFLNKLGRKYELIHTLWMDNKNFEAKFRTEISKNSEDFNTLCDEWVDLFSEATDTVWAKKISNTGPKIRFRKQYQCWTQQGKIVQKELLFDARRCRGTLDMKVLTDNPLTRRKNKHIRIGLNVVVKINFNHLHEVIIGEPLAFFVHHCKPLAEAPKPPIQSNERLPQLVAEMVQKGLNSTQKLMEANGQKMNMVGTTSTEKSNSSNKPELEKLQNIKIELLPKSCVSISKESNLICTTESKTGNIYTFTSFTKPSSQSTMLSNNQPFVTKSLAIPTIHQQDVIIQNINSKEPVTNITIDYVKLESSLNKTHGSDSTMKSQHLTKNQTDEPSNDPTYASFGQFSEFVQFNNPLKEIVSTSELNKSNKPTTEPIYTSFTSFNDTSSDPSMLKMENSQFVSDTVPVSGLGTQTIMVQNLLPIQNLEGVKFQLQPQFPPFTQLVVTTPQLNVPDQLLMLDTAQVVPLNSHPQFVQLHNQGQFL
ncbi:uncharacterized protein LOC109599411 [Aethina tumida]|uniref:uncharacterized protein LOC109599411 n=1 Tax=Aethina tumida TaxID=116153 RepID=UPI0021487BF8|nr:uncharacterized protein LOC109599411 [Aethina tumida]